MQSRTDDPRQADRAVAARTCLAVVLAAGEGTRMRSAVPKVLHRLGGRTMVSHVLRSALDAGIDGVAVVVGPGRDDVAAEVRALLPQAEIFVQVDRLGTAHAVLAAGQAIGRGYDDLLVLYADVPLVRPDTLAQLRRRLAEGADLVALGFDAADPHGYGRLLVADGELMAIREHKDASEAERAVSLCNSGIMALNGRHALAVLKQIGPDNAQREYYLTDAVEVTQAAGRRCAVLTVDEDEVGGVNDRAQLAAAEAILQRRLRAKALAGGATLLAPETVFLSHDTELGRDVLVEPHVVFAPGVAVEDGAVIHAFSHLEGARIGRGASVGPFARLRPGSVIGASAKIGNFVETKSALVEAGAKVSHLSYIGDARIGAEANIGAGTVTCNYDGFSKFKTEIGEGAFVGSNSSLVAPVTVGEGAYIGSGSVITDHVPTGALALGRARQVVKPGWAERFRALRKKR